MVNSGAIATTSLVPGGTLERSEVGLSISERPGELRGPPLASNDQVYASASETK